MKKYVLILPLLFLLAFPAFASNLGNATDKTCYDTEWNTLIYSGFTETCTTPEQSIYCFDRNGNFLSADNTAGCFNTAGDLYASSCSSGDTNVKVVIGIESATTACIGNNYDDCLANISGYEYYTNDVDLSFTGCPVTGYNYTTAIITVSKSIINSSIDITMVVLGFIWPYCLVVSIIGGFIILIIQMANKRKF